MTDYTTYPSLVDLPKLVQKQRRLEAHIAQLEAMAIEEKAVRELIDGLLVGAGLTKGEGVACNGYDVVHHERAGQSRVSAEKLRAAGVSQDVIQAATDTGKPSTYATVRPAKGARVRKAA
jgi:hypothetical protein